MTESKRLRWKLFIFQGIVLAFLCTAVVAAVAVPLYRHLSLEVDKRFANSSRNKAATVSQWVMHAKDLARQITSRTRIRQELQKYNQSFISYQELVDFTAPKLEDAMRHAPEMEGITRLDARGKAVVSLGVPLPGSVLRGAVQERRDVSIGQPFSWKDKTYIWVRAPITDRADTFVGTDFVVLDTEGLRGAAQCQHLCGGGQTLSCNCLLYKKDGEYRHVVRGHNCLAPERMPRLLSGILPGLFKAKGERKIAGFKMKGASCVAAQVDGAPWVLFTCLNQEKLYAPVRESLYHALWLAVLLYALCLLGYWVVLRPLTRRILLRHGELEKEVAAKTSSLKEELEARERAEKALRKSENRLRTLSESSFESIFLSEKGICTDQNLTAEKMFGYTREEAVGRPGTDWILPDDRALVQNNMKKDYASPYEVTALRKDGSTFPCEIQARESEYRGRGIRVTALRDITERKEAEEALRRSEALLARAQAITHIGHWNWEIAGNEVIWSDEVFRILGHQPQAFEVTVDIFMESIHPEDRDTVRGAVSNALKGEEPYNHEHRVLTKKGEVRVVHEIGEVISDHLGKPVRMMGTIQDITERKRAEEEKERLAAQLRHAQKMEAVGTLAGGIAHDFNNILAAIMGYSELAQIELEEGQKPAEELENILQAAERARKLVTQILTFSRKMGSNLKPIDPNDMVAEAASVIERTIPKMISLENDLRPELPLIKGDRAQLLSVLLNLATNARDAMPDGGVITIATKMVDLKEAQCSACGSAFSGQYVVIEFSDNGQGMDPDVLRKVFDPFFTTKEVGKGTGLGLSTVFGIVAGHGGHLICASKPGRGTTIKLFFSPISDDPAETPSREVAADEARGGSESVLLVDDEADLCIISARELSGQGYEVAAAASGEEALEMYQSRKGGFDCVVMDLGMPGIGGSRALKELLRIDPGARVIIASGYDAGKEVKAAMEYGASSFLSKPFRKKALLEKVREVLDA